MRQRTFVHVGQPFFSPFNDFVKEFEKEFNRNTPAQQLYETEEAFLASYDIPGINYSDINIEVEEDTLTISAERKNPFDKSGELTKKYAQTFVLPKNTDLEKISAHYENGVLNLALPKLPEQKNKKKIQVSAGEKSNKWTSFLSLGKKETEDVLN